MKNLRRNLKDQRGFNLIELMIVIAIIALLIGVGIPAWKAMINNGNETTAVQTIQTIKTLQSSYASRHQGKFAANFDELIKSVQLDEKFKGERPVVNGYVFSMTVEEPSLTRPAFIQSTPTRKFPKEFNPPARAISILIRTSARLNPRTKIVRQKPTTRQFKD